MNARQKINNLHMNIFIGTAALIGIVCQSGFLFFATLTVGILYALRNDSIRLRPGDGSHRRTHRRR
jgi:hypothetical protein